MCSAGLVKQGTAWAAEEMGSQLGPWLLLGLPKKSSRKLVSYELASRDALPSDSSAFYSLAALSCS